MHPKNVFDALDHLFHAVFMGHKQGFKPNKHSSLFRGTRMAFAADSGKKWTAFRGGAKGSMKSGLENAFGGYMYMAMPMALFTAGMAPRGHKLSAFAGSSLGMVGSAIGGAVAGVPGSIVGGMLFDHISESTIGRGVQNFSELNRNITALNMGGGFRDTQPAFTMRQAAVREMSGSLMNARQVLGKEAAYMHG